MCPYYHTLALRTDWHLYAPLWAPNKWGASMVQTCIYPLGLLFILHMDSALIQLQEGKREREDCGLDMYVWAEDNTFTYIPRIFTCPISYLFTPSALVVPILSPCSLSTTNRGVSFTPTISIFYS